MNTSDNLFYLAERSSALFSIFDLGSGRFTYMNPTCMTFFGVDNENTDPDFLFAMIHADDKGHIAESITACISGDFICDVECRIMQGNNLRWLRITPFLNTEENQKTLVIQAEEITTTKENAKVLHDHNIKKNSILTMLAHDLAGPLGAIQNFAALLGRETSILGNKRLDKYIDSIERISKNSINLIHAFIEREFLESASVRLVKKRVNLVERINIALTTFMDMRNDLSLEIEFLYSSDKIFVEIDEDKFMQVINNLVSNALKFTPKRGEIKINLEQKNEGVLISISDTGIGIPKAFHDTLFEKFTNAGRIGLNGEVSTGLGMSIIKTIVEWHDGLIWFESEVNVGTTFFIKIPQK